MLMGLVHIHSTFFISLRTEWFKSPQKYICRVKSLKCSSNSSHVMLAALLRSQTTVCPTGAFGRHVLRVSPGPRRMGALKKAGREKREGRVCWHTPGFQSSVVRRLPGYWAWDLRNARMFRGNWFRRNWYKLMKISIPLDFFAAKRQLAYFTIVPFLAF